MRKCDIIWSIFAGSNNHTHCDTFVLLFLWMACNTIKTYTQWWTAFVVLRWKFVTKQYQPTVIYLPYRVSRSTLTAVGHSQLLARWPGTYSRILSGIQRAALTILGTYLNRICSHNTNASSALGVLSDYTNHSLNTSIHGNWLRWLCRRPGIDIL